MGSTERVMRDEMRRHKQKGFSLVELLVVSVIIMVLAATAVPSIARYVRNMDLRGGTEQVQAALQRARTQAVGKNVRQGVVFVVLSPTTYAVVIEDSQDQAATGVARGQAVSVNASLANRTQTPDGVRRLPGRVQFWAAGSPIDCSTAALAGPPAVPAYAFAAVAGAVRFNRLGMACRTGVCGLAVNDAIDTGITSLGGDVGGNMTVCLVDTQRRLARRIRVSPGGRLAIEDVQG
jgi:prepilin-type N-terminal cleavage/methylation domain-containing protein